MELWATGFNAWRQLQFNDSVVASEPDDIYTFKRVLHGDDIRYPVARLEYTIVRQDGTIRCAGTVPPLSSTEILDHRYDRIEAGNGTLFDPSTLVSDDVVHGPQTSLSKAELARILAQHKEHMPGKGKSIAGYEAGFIVLGPNGVPFTTGDERYPACLGREASLSTPAARLAQVSDLCHLPDGHIVKVAAGGYMLGAQTSTGDLYCWGGGPGGPTALKVTGQPEPVDTPDGTDILDFALGEAHIIILTQDRRVYVRGSNHNGQLGLGREASPRSDCWESVDLDLPAGHCVVGVHAGPRASFLVTSATP